MLIIRSSAIILIILFSFVNTFAQNTIKGKVVDAKSGEALAFVNLIFNGNPHFGTVSDIDGNFIISSKNNIKSITCSYVGYQKKIIRLDSLNTLQPLRISLEAASVELQEVTVKADNQSVNRIILNAIKNRKLNNPENVASFKYTSYNKIIYDFLIQDSLESDSTQYKIEKVLKGGHLLIMESVTERKFIAPDISEEIITGSKVSGFKHPSFAALATDIQPFSFYEDIIPIIDINYLNPISKGSLNKYHFQIEDSLYQNLDTVFVISFFPQSNKNFEGLKGVLYINSNKYAIQNVIAEPNEKAFIEVKIQQKYHLIDGKQWFPEQLNFEMKMTQYPSNTVGLAVNGKSYIKDVDLYTDIQVGDLSIDAVKMHEQATLQDSTFWNEQRAMPISRSEEITYEVIDSLGEELNFDGFLKFFEKAAMGKIPIGPVDIDIQKSLIYNDFEGFRWGLGLYTNEKVSKFFSLGGFFGYGSEDKQWKYGAGLKLEIQEENEIEINLHHQNTLRETGSSLLKHFKKAPYDSRSYLAYRMDRIKSNSINFGFRTLRYAKFNFILSNNQLTPQYAFYNKELAETQNSINYSELSIHLKYAFREKLLKSLDQRISMGSKYPILYFSYTKGLMDLLNSELYYNKFEARLEKSFLSKNLGKTNIRLDAGLIDSPLPYALLFTGEGSYDDDIRILINNYFQTVTPYEFLSDKYLNLFLSHHFESLLFKSDQFKPRISIHQNMGWGSLSSINEQPLLEYKTKENILMESGLMLHDLIKMNYLNIGYLGFGAGIFYRYGYYSNEKTMDNISFKISMTFRTK